MPISSGNSKSLLGGPLAAPAGVVVLIVLLAAVNWIMDPAQAGRWLTAMLVLPAIWVVLTVWHLLVLASQRRRGIADEPAVSRYFRSAIALATLAVGIRQATVFALEIWVRVGDRGAGLELEQRVLGIATGIVFIVVGNALPKILTPFSMVPPARAALISIARRFSGTCWVAVGSIVAIAFLLAPLSVADSIQSWGAVAAVLSMLGAIVWMNLAPGREGPAPSDAIDDQ